MLVPLYAKFIPAGIFAYTTFPSSPLTPTIIRFCRLYSRVALATALLTTVPEIFENWYLALPTWRGNPVVTVWFFEVREYKVYVVCARIVVGVPDTVTFPEPSIEETSPPGRAGANVYELNGALIVRVITLDGPGINLESLMFNTALIEVGAVNTSGRFVDASAT